MQGSVCMEHKKVAGNCLWRDVCSVGMQDKINAFWEISKKELEDTRAQLRNKDREMEELEERHQVEIKVCLAPHPQYTLLLPQPAMLSCPCF